MGPRLARLLLLLTLLAPQAGAEIRVSSFRFENVCRVVIVVDNHHRRKVYFDGRLRRGDTLTVDAPGSRVCITRPYNPDDCRTDFIPWRCKIDPASNRSVVFNVP